METSAPPGLGSLVDNLERRFHVNEEAMLEELSVFRSIDAPTPKALRPVRLSPVSTFIHGAKDGRLGYVVSSIAKHWGVVVGDDPKFLYHLVFEDPEDAISNANPDSLTGRNRAVKFEALSWDSNAFRSSTKHVGYTRLSTDELVILGNVQWSAYSS